MATSERGDARIARGGVKLFEVRRLGELPRERMLAPARADQEHLHTRTLATALGGLIAQMLDARGYAIADPVVSEGDDRDVVADFLAAREITRAVEQDKEIDPEDVETAIENYRELYEFLIEDRAAP